MFASDRELKHRLAQLGCVICTRPNLFWKVIYMCQEEDTGLLVCQKDHRQKAHI